MNEREAFWIRQLHPILNSTYTGEKLKTRDTTTQEFFDFVFSQDDEISDSEQIVKEK